MNPLLAYKVTGLFPGPLKTQLLAKYIWTLSVGLSPHYMVVVI